jgi:hypothetical protein
MGFALPACIPHLMVEGLCESFLNHLLKIAGILENEI